MEPGSHVSELESLLLQSFLTAGALDTVFVTLCVGERGEELGKQVGSMNEES